MTEVEKSQERPIPESVDVDEPVPADGDSSVPKAVPHFTTDERVARGKAARAEVPRSAHAEWEPASNRRDPVDLLEEQAKTRVPELVPLRYGRMLVSPFTFFRGAAYLMAADLADGPRTGIHSQLCGDAHLSNFGGFAAPDRRLVLSVNDFDETLPGPFEWDVKRLVASFAVAGRDRGFADRERAAVNRTVTRAYREAMRGFAGMGNLDVWYARLDVDELMNRFRKSASRDEIKRFEGNVAKAQTKDSLKAFAKLTEVVDGEPRIASDPPIVVPIEEIVPPADLHRLDDLFHGVIRSYRRSLTGDRRRLLERYRYVHAARKVVGVGSVGTRAWILLMLGRDESDPLFLQFKEAEASVLEPFLGKSSYNNHGQRVVEGQRLMQSASDIMLGWIRLKAFDDVIRDFYVRHRSGLRLERTRAGRADGATSPGYLRPGLRMDPRESPRPLRGCDRDQRLPGQERCVRPRAGGLRRGLRRPERARLQGAPGGGHVRPHCCRDRSVIARRTPGVIGSAITEGRSP